MHGGCLAREVVWDIRYGCGGPAVIASDTRSRWCSFLLNNSTSTLSFWTSVVSDFMLTGWLATRTAQTSTSLGMQYFAYAMYVLAEALIFVPLLFIADMKAPGAIDSATLVTCLGAGGLMFVAHRTRKDFSFLRAILMWGGVLALIAIIGAAVFGLHMGTWFSVLMIGFAGAAVLYDTSNIIHLYPEDRYVSAAMQLFASIALMFWYVLRLLMGSRN